MTLHDDLSAAQQKLQDDTAKLNNIDAAIADLEGQLAEANAAKTATEADIVADQAEIDRIKGEIAAQQRFIEGLWCEGPDLPTFKADRSDLGLNDVMLAFRESGHGSLDDPVAKFPMSALPPNTKLAIELDPRVGGAHQGNYIDPAKAATDARIVAFAKAAATWGPDKIAYCESDSEGNLDQHRPAGMTDAQAGPASAKFNIAVAKAFHQYAPGIPVVASYTRGLWERGDPDLYLPPALLAVLDGIGCDGYSPASEQYGAPVLTPDQLFNKAFAWITAHGKPMYITEYGCYEVKGAPGTGKAKQYQQMGAWLDKNRSTDGTTGVVHIMFNCRHDGPAVDAVNWKYDTSPQARTAFISLTHHLAGQ